MTLWFLVMNYNCMRAGGFLIISLSISPYESHYFANEYRPITVGVVMTFTLSYFNDSRHFGVPTSNRCVQFTGKNSDFCTYILWKS